jgi:hypothetical protein
MGNPLSIAQYNGQHASVIIYWRPRNVPKAFHPLTNGHAALIIDTSNFDPRSVDGYVSWVGTGSLNRNLASPGEAVTMYDDMTNWAGAPKGTMGLHVPDKWVVVDNLNTAAMLAAWAALRNKPNANWKLLDKNCATTVARILKAGGSDAYATKAKNQLVWWPSDLIKYGRSMRYVLETDKGLPTLDF